MQLGKGERSSSSADAAHRKPQHQKKINHFAFIHTVVLNCRTHDDLVCSPAIIAEIIAMAMRGKQSKDANLHACQRCFPRVLPSRSFSFPCKGISLKASQKLGVILPADPGAGREQAHAKPLKVLLFYLLMLGLKETKQQGKVTGLRDAGAGGDKLTTTLAVALGGEKPQKCPKTEPLQPFSAGGGGQFTRKQLRRAPNTPSVLLTNSALAGMGYYFSNHSLFPSLSMTIGGP